ncbi:MAG TPA: sporulation peptidase YabG [Pseudobacteroides sp.]|uniref:sporulation peptidase YabG n=1 Tax=Pseudobacteroides sp. TaxID=1968840 RepID=UPI002F936341
MNRVKIGDIVLRKSYGCDILFRVADKNVIDGKEIFILNGIHYRIQADSCEDDLVINERSNEIDNFHIAAKTIT